MGKIIGISGKIGSGKDTLADFIIAELDRQGKKHDRIYFASKLKEIHGVLTGNPAITQEQKNMFMEDFGFSAGEGLQKMGDGLRESYHPDVWVISTFRNINPALITLVTDVRYPNEANIVKDKGGVLIRLNGDPAKVRATSTRDINHTSETKLDDYKGWDIVYENNKGIDDLENFAKKLVEDFCL